jgi:hypothetical protein
MNTSRRLLASALVAGFGFAAPLRAEVSAETNALGSYLRTVIYANASVKHPRIWSVSRPRVGRSPLNPDGDATGDLFPAIGENQAQRGWPWALWSHFNGRDYDLVWSRWRGTGWSPVAPVEADPAADDAVDPSLAFGADGRPYAVWLSRGEGTAEVSMSIFLATQWMAPFRISEIGEDAVDPSIAVLPDGRIQVSYDTPVAHVTTIVVFAQPMTILDDLTPFNTVTVSTTESPISKP